MTFTVITLWILFSISVEFMVEIIKQTFPFISKPVYGVDFERVLAFAIGLVMCVGASIDFFDILGVCCTIPYVGFVISAIFIAGGSGGIHQFIKHLK